MSDLRGPLPWRGLPGGSCKGQRDADIYNVIAFPEAGSGILIGVFISFLAKMFAQYGPSHPPNVQRHIPQGRKLGCPALHSPPFPRTPICLLFLVRIFAMETVS